MTHVNLIGLHRVHKKLADGTVVQYHYAWRGGPQFWNSTSAVVVGTEDYLKGFIEASKPSLRSRAAIPVSGKSTSSVIDRFRKSIHYKSKAPRTKRDYDKYLDEFEKSFGEDPIKLFEEKEAVSEIREWKEKWAHSPKQYDYATSVITRLLNWSQGEGASILTHHHKNIQRVYKSNRSDIIWLPEELMALLNVAVEREQRVVIAASEGGLTPQDIGILTREHVQKTPKGRRLYFRRTKTSTPTSIPVTPALGELIDTTPADQKYLVVSLEGRQLTPERASGIVRSLKKRANAAAEKEGKHTVENGRPKIHVRDELRLYDMRGTAATELLRAGCSLNEIAVTMGWGLRHAANIIEKYAALVPEVADEVLSKLTAARKKAAKK